MTLKFAVDTGGTFTDLIIEDGDCLRLFKSPTTPQNPVNGVLNVLSKAAAEMDTSIELLLGRGDLFIHGTTTATNAVVMNRTAKTAFLTTEGHPDVLVIREGGRLGLPLFDYSTPYPEPFVPRALTFEVQERIDASGTVVKPLDDVQIDEIIDRLDELGVEAVAVCLLWSIVNPAHEIRIEARLKERLPNVFVSISHRVNPSLREYRRASATAIDVSLKPIMSRYFRDLAGRLQSAGFNGRLLIVTSQGTMKDAEEVAASPIHTVKSGPAMAPVAGQHYARQAQLGDSAIVADTGGTTYDVALVRHGTIPESRETWIGKPYIGHMTGFPSIDIRSVGAGGGSIARVDQGGMLRVGPDSAGAEPGPACYGQGGVEATVTDAAIILGFIDPKYFLGGQMQLSVSAARQAMSKSVAGPLDLSVERAAHAVMALATETMAGAIEDITVNQGIDPGDAVLIGGGGAAGFNSVAIARRLGCKRVLFPNAGAAISATGGLLCPLSDDVAEFFLVHSGSFDRDAVNALLERLEKRCRAFAEHLDEGVVFDIKFDVEARYAQQIWEIKLPVDQTRFHDDDCVTRLIEHFHRLHREIFAFEDRQADIEFVNWRARVSCDLRQAPLGRLSDDDARSEALTHRQMWMTDSWVEATVQGISSLQPGVRLQGPAVVETAFTSIVLEPDSSFYLDNSGSLVVELKYETRATAA